MSNILKFALRNSDFKTKLNTIKYATKKLELSTSEGIKKEFLFIVLEDKSKSKFITTGFSYYFFKCLAGRRINTLEFHSKVIVQFLNYVFIDNYELYKITSVVDLDIQHANDYLRDYAYGEVGRKRKTKSTIQKVEDVLAKFLYFLIKECSDMKNFNRNSEIEFHVFYEEDVVAPLRVKDMSDFVFSELLYLCEIHYPHLKLALCLQAFGGLRCGEVCNITKDKIHYRLNGNEFAWFEVDLRQKTIMRSDLKSTGHIKKRREQPIHPVFIEIFSKVFEQHLTLIKDIENPYGAIFLNRNGEAITDKSYSQCFTRLIKLLIERLIQIGDYQSKSEANILMSGKTNTHVLRHFFTKFIASLEDSVNPVELAYWRGDSDYNSSIHYLQGNLIEQKVKIVQRKLFERLFNHERK